MRFFWVAILCHLSLHICSQEPDTIRKTRSKSLSLSKFPKKEAPPERKAFVVITSGQTSPEGKDAWENAWVNYIEQQSREIAAKVLAMDGDSAKLTYHVVIEFLADEDGSVKNLKVTCVPAHAFILAECEKMALGAPRKKWAGQSRYVKMSIKQPVDIKIGG
jgi:hypothetical protein